MESLKGYVDRIMFQNEENGYTVIRLLVEEKELICVGHCMGISQGENIEAWGTYEVHPTYGKQFRISEYVVAVPTDIIGIERYLGSAYGLHYAHLKARGNAHDLARGLHLTAEFP